MYKKSIYYFLTPYIYNNNSLPQRHKTNIRIVNMMKLLLVVAISVVLLFSLTDFSGERLKHGESMLSVHLPDFRLIPTTRASGPESFVFDFSGDGPYTGLSDGRIVKWLANDSRWIDFAVTTSTRYALLSASYFFIFFNLSWIFFSSFFW